MRITSNVAFPFSMASLCSIDKHYVSTRYLDVVTGMSNIFWQWFKIARAGWFFPEFFKYFPGFSSHKANVFTIEAEYKLTN